MPPDPDPTDDIEILEVVGLDEDGVPVEVEDPDDVEVVFDDVPPPSRKAPVAARPTTEEIALRERLVRLQADFENFKKRIDRERGDYFRHATSGLVARLLPVLDNFERALAVARSRAGAADPLMEGVVLIQRQLVEELSREGLQAMDPVGSTFDPEMHEAVATDAASGDAPNTVTAVLQRGYFFHDRVLRAALVRVSVDGDAAAPPQREES